jgi:hypothetical protein
MPLFGDLQSPVQTPARAGRLRAADVYLNVSFSATGVPTVVFKSHEECGISKTAEGRYAVTLPPASAYQILGGFLETATNDPAATSTHCNFGTVDAAAGTVEVRFIAADTGDQQALDPDSQIAHLNFRGFSA